MCLWPHCLHRANLYLCFEVIYGTYLSSYTCHIVNGTMLYKYLRIRNACWRIIWGHVCVCKYIWFTSFLLASSVPLGLTHTKNYYEPAQNHHWKSSLSLSLSWALITDSKFHNLNFNLTSITSITFTSILNKSTVVCS